MNILYRDIQRYVQYLKIKLISYWITNNTYEYLIARFLEKINIVENIAKKITSAMV